MSFLKEALGRKKLGLASDAGLDLLHSPLKLGADEVAVAVVNRLELAAIDGHKRFREQAKLQRRMEQIESPTDDRLRWKSALSTLAGIDSVLVDPGRTRLTVIPLRAEFARAALPKRQDWPLPARTMPRCIR